MQSKASDLGIHCLPMSHKKDTRLIWVIIIICCRWTKISRNIASGEILFSQLEHHVGMTYRDDYEAMKSELLAMEINEKIVDRCLKQLQQYRQLETSVRGAKDILKFARLYNLSGNFKQIEDIAMVKINPLPHRDAF